MCDSKKRPKSMDAAVPIAVLWVFARVDDGKKYKRKTTRMS